MTGPTSNLPGAAPAVDSELMPKRAAFIKWAAGRGLDVTEDADAWGARKFVDPHIESIWTGWFNAPATPVVTDSSLLELRYQLWASKVSGAPVTLSHLAAGALHYAMTTSPNIKAAMADVMSEERLQQLKTDAQALAADGGNWSMDVGCMFVLAMIERIESFAAAPPAGYIARADLVKLGNCRAELWAAPPASDAVPVFLGAPAAPKDVCAEMRALCSSCGGTGDVHRADGEWMGECNCGAATPLQEDPLDIVRTLLVAVDGYHSRTSAFEPSPIANNSPVIMAARRACVERGFTAGGLAIEPTGSAT